jgi:drug/metabolite transporter (DMT)-like permease
MIAVGAGLALAGISAVASSSAHALLKSSSDKFAIQAWSSIIGLVIAVPFTFWTGLPEAAILPWLFAGWVLHTIYYLVLVWSYSASDFSVAYPISRGIVPILAAIFGITLLGDRLDPLALAGIVIISVGILMLGLQQGTTRSGLIAAGIAGVLNTCFTLVDAKAMRLAIDPINFLVWYYIADGISMPVLFAMREKGGLLKVAAMHTRTGVAAGIMALFAFLPALIAFRLAPIGAVSAIRATSVIFSLILGGHLLKERMDGRRIGGAVLVTLGVFAIIAGSAFF